MGILSPGQPETETIWPGCGSGAEGGGCRVEELCVILWMEAGFRAQGCVVDG